MRNGGIRSFRNHGFRRLRARGAAVPSGIHGNHDFRGPQKSDPRRRLAHSNKGPLLGALQESAECGMGEYGPSEIMDSGGCAPGGRQFLQGSMERLQIRVVIKVRSRGFSENKVWNRKGSDPEKCKTPESKMWIPRIDGKNKI